MHNPSLLVMQCLISFICWHQIHSALSFLSALFTFYVYVILLSKIQQFVHVQLFLEFCTQQSIHISKNYRLLIFVSIICTFKCINCYIHCLFVMMCVAFNFFLHDWVKGSPVHFLLNADIHCICMVNLYLFTYLKDSFYL